jgi:hypothetical protein
MDVPAATVADTIRSEVTRIATLNALEALAPPIPSAVALAAAPALVDAMATEKDRAAFDRCGLLLARLAVEALPEPAAVYGAAMAGERSVIGLTPALIAEAVQRASSGQPLTREDARSYACLLAIHVPAYVRGCTVPWAAAGYTVMEFLGIVRFLTTLNPKPFYFPCPLTPARCRRVVYERGVAALPAEDALGRRAAADADAAGRCA